LVDGEGSEDGLSSGFDSVELEERAGLLLDDLELLDSSEPGLEDVLENLGVEGGLSVGGPVSELRKRRKKGKERRVSERGSKERTRRARQISFFELGRVELRRE